MVFTRNFAALQKGNENLKPEANEAYKKVLRSKLNEVNLGEKD